MDPINTETWLPLISRAVAYTAMVTKLAWILHLMARAVRASLSPGYERLAWVKGDRGLVRFFTVAYEFMLLLPLELIGEYARQPESVVSFNTYVRDVMHAKYTLFGDNVLDNNTQKPIVYRELFQKLSDKMGMMNEELVLAMKAVLIPDEKGEINMWDTATKFLSRTSNRIIVGHPLCRNQEYLDAAVHYAVSMFSTAVYIQFIPPFLRPLLAPLLRRSLTRDRDIVAKHAIPIIEERMRLIELAEETGVEPGLPNDLLSAAMNVARKDPNSSLEYTPIMLVNRILAFNFLQSYSNTLTLTNSVYDLISLPEDLFNQTVTDLRNLRTNPIGEVGLERTIMSKDGFTFSNGLHVPKGATLAAPMKAIQHDAKNYPGGFNPKRALQDPTRPRITAISPDFLNFGLGRPACSGRWFAANLQKLALGQLIMDFDFERVDERPQGVRKITLVEPTFTLLLIQNRTLIDFDCSSVMIFLAGKDTERW
ncbi:putative Ent-kaurene oxidase [Seiridium cardinale]|uniref:Ent-kaurene oxidase n=1 Tax=Seiridium cardinale TaxID=138064 RepID=A0ABR2XWL9_9PEZI